jgi:hypothetical protein
MISSARRALITASSASVLCFAGAAVSASAAQADALLGQKTCPSSAVSQPFAQWGDQSSYELAPGGDFETASWTLNNGAQRVAGSEPYDATVTPGASSLSLPAGGSAQSPAMCLDASDPTLRFFVNGTGSVLVQVVDGSLVLPVGLVTGSGQWAPSSTVATGSGLLGALGGGTAQLSVRFTALTGNPQIDDVFIDPWNRH